MFHVVSQWRSDSSVVECLTQLSNSVSNSVQSCPVPGYTLKMGRDGQYTQRHSLYYTIQAEMGSTQKISMLQSLHSVLQQATAYNKEQQPIA